MVQLGHSPGSDMLDIIHRRTLAGELGPRGLSCACANIYGVATTVDNGLPAPHMFTRPRAAGRTRTQRLGTHGGRYGNNNPPLSPQPEMRLMTLLRGAASSHHALEFALATHGLQRHEIQSGGGRCVVMAGSCHDVPFPPSRPLECGSVGIIPIRPRSHVGTGSSGLGDCIVVCRSGRGLRTRGYNRGKGPSLRSVGCGTTRPRLHV